MKILDVSATSATVGFPVKSGTLQFLQLAYQEALTAIANNLLGAKADSTNTYILYGCVLSGSGPYGISGGAVYYNGTVYLVAATAGITLSGGQVIVGNINPPTQYTANADPVLFTDGTSRNVHNIYMMNFAAGTSGSGTVDFSNLKTCGLGLLNEQNTNFAGGGTYTVKFDQDRAAFLGSVSGSNTLAIVFELTDAIPGAVVRLKTTVGSSASVIVTAGSGHTVLLDSGDLTKCPGNTNTFYFLYAGVGDSGNAEISYSVNQTA